MKELTGCVAVITGGASGIGLAMARVLAREGMKLVLADIESAALDAVVDEFRSGGTAAIAVPTDVSRPEQVDGLAGAALDAFGAVHIVCNNAGVSPPSGPIWTNSLDDWHWTFNVNVWGVVHGIRTFVPILLRQGEPAHVVNTASVAGLLSTPQLGVYHASKHAVVTISETLEWELRDLGVPIGVSVLCPGWTQTRISDSGRNRPQELAQAGESTASGVQFDDELRRLVANGRTAAEIAEAVLRAIHENRLHILTHPEFDRYIQRRTEKILAR